MGYWNGWANYEEWFIATQLPKICKYCESEFYPKNGNQRVCNRENNPECDDNRYYQKLWNKGKHPLQSHS